MKCYLDINIKNYASSYLSVLIDYGDGSNETIYINPYCKFLYLFKLSFLLLNLH